MLGWIYTLFFIFLGCSAAIWGGWLEHAGLRKAGVVSALCWCGGLTGVLVNNKKKAVRCMGQETPQLEQ